MTEVSTREKSNLQNLKNTIIQKKLKKKLSAEKNIDISKFILKKHNEHKKNISKKIGLYMFMASLKKFDDSYPGHNIRLFPKHILSVRTTKRYSSISEAKKIDIGYKFDYENFLKKVEDNEYDFEYYNESLSLLLDFFDFYPKTEDDKEIFEDWKNYSIMYSSGLIKSMPYYVLGSTSGHPKEAYKMYFQNWYEREYINKRVLKEIDDICLYEIKKDKIENIITSERLSSQWDFHQIFIDFFINKCEENEKRFDRLIQIPEIKKELDKIANIIKNKTVWNNFFKEILSLSNGEGTIRIHFYFDGYLKYTNDGFKYLSKETNPVKLRCWLIWGTVFAIVAAVGTFIGAFNPFFK